MNPRTNQPQAASVTVGKSRLSIVGLILSIALPPVGLIVSVIALSTIKKNHLSGRGKAVFGIVWSAVFTLPALFVAWLVVVTANNKATNDIQPLVSQIQAVRGKKLCDNGDSGFGIDNTQPWSEAYYVVPDSPRLTDEIKESAAHAGYPLSVDTGYVKELQYDQATETNYLPPDTPAYNISSDYLVSYKSNKGTLTVKIYRNTSVPLNCGVANYGKLQPTGNSNAIIDMQLTLPSRA